jgi:hypothetical protein
VIKIYCIFIIAIILSWEKIFYKKVLNERKKKLRNYRLLLDLMRKNIIQGFLKLKEKRKKMNIKRNEK